MARRPASALQTKCPKCQRWVYWQIVDDVIPVAIEMQPALRQQVVDHLIARKFVLRRTDMGDTGRRFSMIDVPTLARLLHSGIPLSEIPYKIHVAHPHHIAKVAFGAQRGHTGPVLPVEPPF